jgi:hypothetical protein
MSATTITDPRNVAETFANVPHSVYLTEGQIHITLGLERPALASTQGARFKVEREVVLRIVMPANAAMTLANGIRDSLSPLGQLPQNQPLQS